MVEDEIVDCRKRTGYSCRIIAEKFGLKKDRVNYILKKALGPLENKTCRRYSFNHSYFDQIDTEEKAYFLGLLYADGCNGEDTGCIKIALQARDRKILDRFKEAVGTSRPLSFIKRRMPHHQDYWCLEFNSKALSRQLSKLGCVKAKSLILKFPTEQQVPKHLQRHFIRGYFDGDGSISLYRNKKTNSYKFCGSIVSSREFCDKITEILFKELGVNTWTKTDKRASPLVGYLNVSGTNQVCKWLEWMYDEASIYLERKYDKYQEAKVSLLDRKRETRNFCLAFGEEKSVGDWAKDPRSSVICGVIIGRLKNGWLPEEAITTPLQRIRKKK